MFLPTRNHPFHAVALILALLVAGARSQEETSPEILLAQGDHLGAIALLEEYAAIYEEDLAASDRADIREKLARVEIWLGSIELEIARSEPAVDRFSSARYLLTELPDNPRLLGTCFDGLGRALHHAGRYDEALAALSTALRHRESLPEDLRTTWATATREHLGLLYLAMGRYREAGEALQQALAQTPAGDESALAQREASLGRYFHTIRNYTRARGHLESALARAENAWGREHSGTFTILDQLGLTLLRLGETADARAAFEEAVGHARDQAGSITGGLRYASILNNFGNLLIAEEATDEAQALFQEALAALEKTLGDGHPALAPLKNNLAYTFLAHGDHESAEQLYEEARSIYLQTVGPHHQRSVEALNNLALASFLGGRAGSRERIAEAAEAHQNVLRKLLSFGSETQRLNYLQRADPVSLPCTAGEDPGMIANILLRTKGRLLDSLLSEQGRNQALPQPEPTWQDVQQALIEGSVLVDFVRYHAYDPTGTATTRYGAIVLARSGEPKWISLGDERTLANWLGAIQERLAWRSSQLGNPDPTPPPPLKLQPALRRLYDEFWAPIASALDPDTCTVVFCPDATLNFLSFATLVDPGNDFLCHKIPWAVYVTSARDLLTAESGNSLTGKPWTIFSVDEFTPAVDDQDGETDIHQHQLSETLSRLQAIAGAAEEVEVLEKHLPAGSRVFHGKQASESNLRAITDPPAVLHLVTHGFFLPGALQDTPRLTDFDEDPGKLRRSGLVLRRPAPTGPAGDNDILFAGDVARLHLEGTRLVTLSSCDSGLGEDLAGEGVLGLRRGFALAGARNQFLTLWPVSDDSTPEFMDRFYQLATHTDHLAQAAWQTQREFLSEASTSNESALEEAVLRYGPFVLCQREPLQAAANSLPSAAPAGPGIPPKVAAGLGALVAIGLLHWAARRHREP